MPDDVTDPPLVIGRHTKLALLGEVGEQQRHLEQWWQTLDLAISRDDHRAVLLKSLSSAILVQTVENGTTTADLVLLAAFDRVLAARSWGERRMQLVDLAAHALNWRLAGDRRAVVPPMAST